VNEKVTDTRQYKLGRNRSIIYQALYIR